MTINTKTENGHVRVLSDGSQMPMLGLGVWQIPNGPERVNTV
jgi:diketogulonate reductase-like aldo/keto reductase